MSLVPFATSNVYYTPYNKNHWFCWFNMEISIRINKRDYSHRTTHQLQVMYTLWTVHGSSVTFWYATIFPVHIRGIHKWNTILCTPLGCAVHHLPCTAQPKERTGMGQVFTFAGGGVVEYCAHEKITLGWSISGWIPHQHRHCFKTAPPEHFNP